MVNQHVCQWSQFSPSFTTCFTININNDYQALIIHHYNSFIDNWLWYSPLCLIIDVYSSGLSSIIYHDTSTILIKAHPATWWCNLPNVILSHNYWLTTGMVATGYDHLSYSSGLTTGTTWSMATIAMGCPRRPHHGATWRRCTSCDDVFGFLHGHHEGTLRSQCHADVLWHPVPLKGQPGGGDGARGCWETSWVSG